MEDRVVANFCHGHADLTVDKVHVPRILRVLAAFVETCVPVCLAVWGPDWGPDSPVSGGMHDVPVLRFVDW